MSNLDVRQYSPANYTPSWGAIPFSGFADGEFCNLEFVEDETFETVGADGEVALVDNRSRLFTVSMTLLQTSPTNALVSAAVDAAALAGNARLVLPFTLTDRGGTTVFAAPRCWVKKRPAIVLGKQHSNRTWVLAGVAGAYFVGGA